MRPSIPRPSKVCATVAIAHHNHGARLPPALQPQQAGREFAQGLRRRRGPRVVQDGADGWETGNALAMASAKKRWTGAGDGDVIWER